MSYATPNKSFPNILKSIPQKLAQPTGIAVVASVGIHALLGLSLPYLTLSSPDKPKPVRNVQLLELSPQELSQLPPPPLPSMPSLPPALDKQLQPLSPNSPSSTLPSLPTPDFSFGDLPAISGLPKTSAKRTVDPKQLGGIYDSPLRTDLASPKSKEPALPPDRLGESSAKSPKTSFEIAKDSRIPTQSNLRALGRDLGGLTQNLEPAPLFQPQPGSLQSSQQNSQIAANPGATGSPVSGQTPPALPGQGNALDSNVVNDYQALLRQQAQLQQQEEDWKQSSQVEGPVKELPILMGQYPQKAREAGVSAGSVQVNWKVDKDGNIIANSLNVIASSDQNGVFDEEALAAVRRLKIPATGKEEAYKVRITFMDSSSPGEGTVSPATATQEKKTTEPSNSSQPSAPTSEQNSSQPKTPRESLTPPQGQEKPEWSAPTEGKTPASEQNSSEQLTPMERLTPAERENLLQQLTPTQRSNPSQRIIPMEQRLTPAERQNLLQQAKPGEQPNSSGQITPIELIPSGNRPGAPEQSTPTPRQTTKPQSTTTEEQAPTERQAPKRETTPTQRQSPTEQEAPKPESTPTQRQSPTSPRQSTPDSPNSPEESSTEKSQKLAEPQTSEQPQRLPGLPSSVKPQTSPQG
jgi:TonB family protein